MINVQRMFFTTTTTGDGVSFCEFAFLCLAGTSLSQAWPIKPISCWGRRRQQKRKSWEIVRGDSFVCSLQWDAISRYCTRALLLLLLLHLFTTHCTGLSPPEKKLLEDHVGQTFDCVLLFSPLPLHHNLTDHSIEQKKMLSFHLSLPHF